MSELLQVTAILIDRLSPIRRADMVTTNNKWNSLGGYTGILSQSYAAEIKPDTLKQLDVALLATGYVMGNLAPNPKEPYNDGAVCPHPLHPLARSRAPMWV